MSAPSPAEEMRQAATLLEAVQRYLADSYPLPDDITSEQWRRANAMHPDVRTALARWLEQAADALDGTEVPDDEPALVLARAVLGGEADR